MNKLIVLSTTYEAKHSKKGDLMFVVSHETEGRKYPTREYILFEHKGYGRIKAEDWWKYRAFNQPPDTVEEALERVDDIRQVSELTVVKDNNFEIVIYTKFADEIEKESLEDDDVPF